jgi:pimeloyl-ACP methyl ester carboxylesterase
MTKAPHLHPADLVAFGRLATDTTLGVTDVVEAVHRQAAFPSGGRDPAFGTGIAGIVYNSIRGVTRLVEGGLSVLTPLMPPTKQRRSSPEREALVAALNGVLGDYLVGTNNPLAISMSLRRHGRSLEIERGALQATLSQPTGKVLLLAHGLCLNDLQWQRKGHDHGAALASELGYTAVYLHYNTGLHVSENGCMLADLMEKLLGQWPVPIEELAIIGHSMGGLVSRSAYHYGTEAGHDWPRHLRRLIFLGVPHHGAPLERIGNWVNAMLEINPYTSPFARLGRIRSAGITDMRHGSLLEQDWKGRDRFALAPDVRIPLPLPAGVQCYAIAATKRRTIGDSSHDVLGDGLVPVDSALGLHRNPEMSLAFSKTHQQILPNMNHWDLLSHPAVNDRIRRWFG